MIEFITGMPGDGKSLLGTKLMIDDIADGNAFVVTNVPVKLPELRAYVVAKRGPDGDPFDLDASLKVLKKDEVFEFYRFRSGGLVLPESPDRRPGLGGRNNASERMDRDQFIRTMDSAFELILGQKEYQRPVHFYIDEVHNFFSSRDWATNGRSTLYYASQHRHLHDNVWLMTQVMENVEKQLRSLVSETHRTRNFLRRSVGPFRMRPRFLVKSYYGVPSGREQPFHTQSFALDAAGVAGCYETTGALGVHKAAEKVKNKGFLPWWSLPVGGIGVVAALALIVAVVPRWGFRAIIGRAGFGRVVPASHSVQSPPALGTAGVVASGPAPASTQVLVFAGVSGIGGDEFVFLPEYGEWYRAKKLAQDYYKLGDGIFARRETLEERKKRVRTMYDESGGASHEAQSVKGS
jgi:hypothetical protein